MKLTIDIPDSYKDLLPNIQNGSIACKIILDAVKNGTPYEERPKGKWEHIGFGYDYVFCKCSECGKTTRLSKNEFCCITDIRNKVIACLYCGADMR